MIVLSKFIKKYKNEGATMIEKIKKVYVRLNSKNYVNYLRKIGCRIGEGTKFFYPYSTTVDETRPWLVEIGKNCQITKNFSLLTHGYDWSVLKGKFGDILGSSGKVKIGDNCFIGFNVTITKSVTIGNNVIIGANSLVTHDIPDNVVVGGVPAKVIMTLDEYYEKRKSRQLEEAKELVNEYYLRYNKYPDEELLREFYWLFKDRNIKVEDDKVFYKIMNLVGNYDQSLKKFKNTNSTYNGYEDFISTLKEGRKNE